MARSLNRVQLIGNLTRDPELRYTPSGTAVCTFGLATNRSWTTDTGEKKEETEFHKIVAWNKLGELCSQLLSKGRKVYVEGRLAYRKYTNKDGVEQNTTEIVIDDMMVLDPRRDGGVYQAEGQKEPGESRPKADQPVKEESQPAPRSKADQPIVEKTKDETAEQGSSNGSEQAMTPEEIADDIPF